MRHGPHCHAFSEALFSHDKARPNQHHNGALRPRNDAQTPGLIMEKHTPTPPNAVKLNLGVCYSPLDVTAGEKRQSTPSNRVSASISEHLTNVRYVLNICGYNIVYKAIYYSLDDVSPSILADIRNHATCTVEALLNYLLSLCLLEEHKHNEPAGLLDQCISAVLPICNTQDYPIQTKGKQKCVDEGALVGGLGLRKYLTE